MWPSCQPIVGGYAFGWSIKDSMPASCECDVWFVVVSGVRESRRGVVHYAYVYSRAVRSADNFCRLEFIVVTAPERSIPGDRLNDLMM